MRDYQSAIDVAELQMKLRHIFKDSKLMIQKGDRSYLVEGIRFIPNSSIADNELVFECGVEVEY